MKERQGHQRPAAAKCRDNGNVTAETPFALKRGHTRSRLFVSTASAAERDDRGGKLQRSTLVLTENESERERDGRREASTEPSASFCTGRQPRLAAPACLLTITRQNVSHLHIHTAPPSVRDPNLLRWLCPQPWPPSLARAVEPLSLSLPELRDRKSRLWRVHPRCDDDSSIGVAVKGETVPPQWGMPRSPPHMRRVAWMDASAASARRHCSCHAVAPTACIWIVFWFGADNMPGCSIEPISIPLRTRPALSHAAKLQRDGRTVGLRVSTHGSTHWFDSPVHGQCPKGGGFVGMDPAAEAI